MTDTITLPRATVQQALEAWDDPMGMKDLCVAMDALRTALEQQQAEPVAWDVFELRLYGAPQEKQHRVLWVDRYIYPDGSTPDLDSLLDAAKTEGGIDGRAKTLHVRPLYTTPQRQWDKPGTSFNDWWNGDYDDAANPFEKDSAAYWAWAGWKAAQRKWQGLTDDDCARMSAGDKLVAMWAEAILKEKNT